jgi:putative transposase
MQPRHPQRLPSFPYVGLYRYSLRFRTFGSRALFVSPPPVDLVWSQFSRAAAETGVAVLAYCFMPEHVHLLVQGAAEDAALKPFISRAKQFSGFHFKRVFGVELWQRYCFERVLRDNEPTAVVARYILENPVRAGLAERIEGYPFIGSGVFRLTDLIEAAYSGAPLDATEYR